MRYAELWAKSNFSFLEGASQPEELVARAAELGCHALMIGDRNSLAGVVRAHAAAKEIGFKLLIGAEITPVDTPPLTLITQTIRGYRTLSRLITLGRRAAEKGQCTLTLDNVAQHTDDLLAVFLPTLGDDVASSWQSYRDLFGDRAYLAAAVHLGPSDGDALAHLARLSRSLRVPMIATNHVHYHDPARRPLHEVLTAVKHHTTVAELGALRFPNSQRHLKSPAEMARLFASYPDAVARTVEAADRCTFSLDELRYQYPEEIVPAGHTPTTYLAELTWAGAARRYPAGIPDKVRTLLHRELDLIAELRYEAFFLTVWDIVEFARRRDILCQGRGSAANSAVCYCIGITCVDPERGDLLFERFMSKERNEPPDIDVDFEHERREEVFQYIYGKYGRERAGIVAEVITYQPRSAVRDVGKALGLSLDAVDRLAKSIEWSQKSEVIARRIREAGLDPRSPGVQHLIALTGELIGFPRHLSQHVGGFVITGGPLSEMVPIENAAMPDRTVIQWNKDDLDTLGILKVDCLALGMLTALQKCFRMVRNWRSKVDSCQLSVDSENKDTLLTTDNYQLTTISDVPPEDPATYDMICKADTVGVFQIESRAQMSMLPRLQPRTFYDLVVEVAIVRPGPIQGGMVHPYLRRRMGQEEVTYPHPIVEEVLSKTLGVPLFQEQVMRLAIVAAGFTPGEADQLRRAMGAWRRTGVLEKFRDKFRNGLLARGFTEEFADQIYEQIKGFSEYGFPESHAASFALLAYVSAWLKCHHPAAFTTALLNSQPMGFYAPAQLIYDVRSHGVEVYPVDVNHSEWDCTLTNPLPSPLVLKGRGTGGEGLRNPSPNGDDSAAIPNPLTPDPSPPSTGARGAGPAIRLGFRLIRGFSQTQVERLMAARVESPFRSVADVARRSDVSRALLTRLAAADGFASLGLDRRSALWKILDTGEDLPLFAGLDDDIPPPTLPTLSPAQDVVADYQSVGLSLKAHPIGLVRSDLDRLGAISGAQLEKLADKSPVRVAGLVLLRQRPPTANGTVFMSLEDETGLINLIIWSRTWERFRKIARHAVALFIDGKVERADGVIHVCPTRIDDLSHALRGINVHARDFR